jgi:peroxiredoxin
MNSSIARFTLFFVIFIGFWGQACLFAQQASLRFRIKGLHEPLATLVYYSGGRTYKADSTRIDTTDGSFLFQTKGLKPGVHLVTIGSKRLLEFIVTKPDEQATITGDLETLPLLTAENSPENSVFLAFEAERVSIEESIESRKQMINLIQKATRNDAEALKEPQAALRAAYGRIDSLVSDYQTRYPQHLYARMLRSVRLPEAPKDLQPSPDGKTKPGFLDWVRKHYFDHTDFKDEALLQNKIWNLYFDSYFERLIAPSPDSIIQALDGVLGLMPKDGAFYRWAVVRSLQAFEQNDEPGADRIFVHLVDKYQKVKETPWSDEATLLRLEYKASVFRPVLSGNVAPDISLQDRSGAPKSLHAVQSPMTLLIFYSPLCKHCMSAMPDIYQNWLDARQFGLAAVAVNTDSKYEYWKNFVNQQNYEWMDLADPTGENAFEKIYNNYNLPVIFLLDQDKRIIRKRIKPENLRETLKYYLKK